MAQIHGLSFSLVQVRQALSPLTSASGTLATSVFIELSFPCPSYLQE